MSDIYCPYGGDFSVDQSGDIQEATGWDEVEQKLSRDLLTSPAKQLPNGRFTPAEYLFHPTYGLGLKQFLGQLADPNVISSLRDKCIQQIRQDNAIAISPSPIVFFKVFPAQFLLKIFIQVTLASNESGTLAVEVSPD